MRIKRLGEITPLDGLQIFLAVLLMYWSTRYAMNREVLPVVSAMLLGVGFLACALGRLTADESRQDLITLGLGIAALLAPFLLGFADIAGAKGPHLKIGLVVTVLTVVQMAERASKRTRTGEA